MNLAKPALITVFSLSLLMTSAYSSEGDKKREETPKEKFERQLQESQRLQKESEEKRKIKEEEEKKKIKLKGTAKEKFERQLKSISDKEIKNIFYNENIPDEEKKEKIKKLGGDINELEKEAQKIKEIEEISKEIGISPPSDIKRTYSVKDLDLLLKDLNKKKEKYKKELIEKEKLTEKIIENAKKLNIQPPVNMKELPLKGKEINHDTKDWGVNEWGLVEWEQFLSDAHLHDMLNTVSEEEESILETLKGEIEEAKEKLESESILTPEEEKQLIEKEKKLELGEKQIDERVHKKEEEITKQNKKLLDLQKQAKNLKERLYDAKSKGGKLEGGEATRLKSIQNEINLIEGNIKEDEKIISNYLEKDPESYLREKEQKKKITNLIKNLKKEFSETGQIKIPHFENVEQTETFQKALESILKDKKYHLHTLKESLQQLNNRPGIATEEEKNEKKEEIKEKETEIEKINNAIEDISKSKHAVILEHKVEKEEILSDDTKSESTEKEIELHRQEIKTLCEILGITPPENLEKMTSNELTEMLGELEEMETTLKNAENLYNHIQEKMGEESFKEFMKSNDIPEDFLSKWGQLSGQDQNHIFEKFENKFVDLE